MLFLSDGVQDCMGKKKQNGKGKKLRDRESVILDFSIENWNFPFFFFFKLNRLDVDSLTFT